MASRAKLLDELYIAVACERRVHIIACREDAFEHVRTVEHDERVRDLIGLEGGRLLVVTDESHSKYGSEYMYCMCAQYSVWDVQTGECYDALAHFCQVDLLLARVGLSQVLAVERWREDGDVFEDTNSDIILIDTNTWTMRRCTSIASAYVRTWAVGDGCFVFGHNDGCSVLSTSNWKAPWSIDLECSVESVHVMAGTRVFVGTSTSRIVECALVQVPVEEEEEEGNEEGV